MERSTRSEIERVREDIRRSKERLRKLVAEAPPEPVPDYEFGAAAGATVRLSDLFGSHDDLLVVHNMGRGCRYCTMWADGFVSLLPHLASRVSFAISSPDAPETQAEFAASRHWPFRMVSTADSPFTTDMGFRDGDQYMPGVSAFHRNTDGTIVRTGSDQFGPYDDYNSAWNLFSLLREGAGTWAPEYDYIDAGSREDQ
jgi:predicted dithiol-disulfide oxidoreductase (DUF899 family)